MPRAVHVLKCGFGGVFAHCANAKTPTKKKPADMSRLERMYEEGKQQQVIIFPAFRNLLNAFLLQLKRNATAVAADEEYVKLHTPLLSPSCAHSRCLCRAKTPAKEEKKKVADQARLDRLSKPRETTPKKGAVIFASCYIV
jgi:hypothetical protein